MPETLHQGTSPLAGGARATRLPLRPLIGLIAALAVMDVTMGLTYPLLALILESRGYSTAVIGLNAAMFPIGLIAVSPLVPRLARSFGSIAFVLGCVTMTICLLVFLKILPALGFWFVLCFLLGGSTGGLFVVTEAWIMELSTEATRGRVVAIYTSLLSLGFATGPLLLAWTGIEGWAPFLAGIGCAVVGLSALYLVRDGLPAAPEEAHVSVLSFMPLAPALLLAVVVFAMFDTSAMSLIPLYGLRHGLDQATANYALSVLIAGNVLLQFPIGWLADRMPRRHVMLGCAGATVLGAILAPHAIATLWQWPLFFFWGSTAFGVFTLALAELGDRFTGAQLLAGSAAFALCWGFGGILGPPLSGTAMTAFGPEGLPLILGASFVFFTLVALWRAFRRPVSTPGPDRR
jgi:MFS family permease